MITAAEDRLAAVEREAGNRVAEDIGHQGEYGPPVSRRAGRGAGLGYGIAVSEERPVDAPGGFVYVGEEPVHQANDGIGYAAAFQPGQKSAGTGVIH